MLAHDAANKEAGAINAMTPFEQIEMHLTSCFKVATNSHKKKYKKPADPEPTTQEFNWGLSVNAAYQEWGIEGHAIHNQDEENTKAEQMQQLAWSDDDVNMASQ